MKTNYLSSKTDPFRRGHTIYLQATNSPTCLLHAFQLYSSLTSPPNKSLSSPVFSAVIKSLSSPVFSAVRFSPLTREKLNTVIRNLLQQAGCNQSHYASHGFRIGAATTAAAVALPSWLIQKLGRWSNNT